MGSSETQEPCPKCNYQFAVHTLYYNIQELCIFCERCGYSLIERPNETDESHGIGAFTLGYEGTATIFGSLCEGGLDKLLKDFKEGKIVNENGQPPTILTYTFLKDGEWHFKDIITNKVKPFPIDLFIEYRDILEVK